MASTCSRSSALRAQEVSSVVGKETGFPLIQCTSCGLARVVELRAWTEGNHGRIFFKCPRNIQGVGPAHGGCGFFYWQKDYFHELVKMRKISVHQDLLIDWCEDEAVLGHVPDWKLTSIDTEAKIDVVIRTVKMLFFMVFVGVVVGIMYALK
ncbi:hypothetical protein HU200_044470 [Digitaria exilis]|uniref:GRF-type domain-containing protein n=1 Tax=Digitaria exilis TaxID=1010633 RepID=A0A835EG82_9POAL|nr:hypothetical protein HU200_044470 [Digitaria exilis]